MSGGILYHMNADSLLSVGCADEQQRNGIICEMKTNIKHKSSVMSTYHASKESDSKKYLTKNFQCY
uniref:Bm503, isoform d n=1 Tax=Brugia malayi TaxID=6279 RepID=A0A1I9G2S6_BRUMA|nr:Bm503, isoform d [Brugia malayi]